MMPKLIPDAVYVAVGRVAGAELAKLASPVAVEEDNLLLGPSSVLPRRHGSLRARTWGTSPSRELNEELARPGGPPLCVALPPTPLGILSLCRVCASALPHGRAAYVVDLGPEAGGPSPRGPGLLDAIVLDFGAALRRNPRVAQWSRIEATLAGTLWRLWCRRSPVAFSRFCASAGELHPQL